MNDMKTFSATVGWQCDDIGIIRLNVLARARAPVYAHCCVFYVCAYICSADTY